MRQAVVPPLRRAGQPGSRAAVAVDAHGAGPGHDRPSAAGGGAGQGAGRAGELSAVRGAGRGDRGGERGDLRGPAGPGSRCRSGP